MKNPTHYSDREGNTIPLTKGDIRRLRKIEQTFHPAAHNTYRHIPLDAFSLNRIFFYRPLVTAKMLEDPKTLPFNIGDYIPAFAERASRVMHQHSFGMIPATTTPAPEATSEVADVPEAAPETKAAKAAKAVKKTKKATAPKTDKAPSKDKPAPKKAAAKPAPKKVKTVPVEA